MKRIGRIIAVAGHPSNPSNPWSLKRGALRSGRQIRCNGCPTWGLLRLAKVYCQIASAGMRMPPRTVLRLLLFISLCSTVTSAGVAEVERRENSFYLPKCSNVVKQHRALSLCVTVTSRDVSLTRHSEQVHSALVLRNSHGNRFCFLHFDCKSNTDGETSQYGFHRKLTLRNVDLNFLFYAQ